MTGDSPLRIGLFTHSTNPRGGVVHVLELAAALGALGHEVVVHAPDPAGRGFFRPPVPGVRHVLIPSRPGPAGLGFVVRQRIGEYVDYLIPRGEEFNVYHAHDGISGGALAIVADAGIIPGFVRTVHHLDEFADPYLRQTQDRSVASAAMHICVSRLWRDTLKCRYGLDAAVVQNGVDTVRFASDRQADDDHLCQEFVDFSQRPMFLAVGGVERRKNTLHILRAFLQVRGKMPNAGLLIVGGATLLDHSDYRRLFDRELAAAGDDAARSVRLTGPLPERAMAPVYHLSDVLVFPSVVEGFGLAVIEAMACGTPVIASRIAPFTEYLSDDDALLVDPMNVDEIAAAMVRALDPCERGRLRRSGLAIAARFDWAPTAAAHVRHYRDVVFKRGRRQAYAANAFSRSLA